MPRPLRHVCRNQYNERDGYAAGGHYLSDGAPEPCWYQPPPRGARPGSRFAVDGKLPRTVLLIHIDAAYFHCSKAIVRSRLWDRGARIERDRLPSAGAMHRRLSGGTFDGDSYDRDLPARTVAGLY